MVGKLEAVELREVWSHEAKDFTTWLAENLDVLSEQLDLELELVETEKAVGPFSADIVASDEGGTLAIIENQLGKTDHSHLGQILTYAINVDAGVVIWVSPQPRPEHTKVITYLSDNTSIDFYLVKVQAFKIGESEPAPLFTVVTGPSEDTRHIAKVAKDFTETQRLELKFWKQLLEKSNAINKLFANITAAKGNWCAAGAGKGGLAWVFEIRRNEGRAALALTANSKEEEDLAKAKKRYEKLLNKRKEIEVNYGGSLEWDFKDTRKHNYVKTVVEGGLKNEDKWDDIQDEMVDRMDRLEKVLRSRLSKL